MFFIYGRKEVLEDDTWSGELECPNCGAKTKHIFKLRKLYPTIFFITIPLPRTLKRHLVCTNCGANHVVKKAEYESLKQGASNMIEQ